MGAKVAVTVLAALIVTEQAPVPVQAPLQPVNVEPVAAAAVRVDDGARKRRPGSSRCRS